MALGWMKKAALKFALGREVLKTMSGTNFDYFFLEKRDTSASRLWPDRTTKEQEDYYRKRDLVYTCISRIKTAYKEAKLEIGRETPDGGWEPVRDHPRLSLMRNPNPSMSWGMFIDYHIVHLMSTGRSLIWKWRNRGTDVAELWPIPTSWAQPQGIRNIDPASNKRTIDFWQLTVPGYGTKRVEVEDIIDDHFIDPSDFMAALGPLQAAGRELTIDDQRENYLIEMLSNIQVPGLIIKQRDEFTPAQKEDIRAALKDTIGPGKRGSPLLIAGEDSDVRAVTPLSDMDWPGLTSLSESRICAVFGVPPALAGMRVGLQTTGLSGNDVSSIKRLFYETTIMGLWISDADVFTRALLDNERYPGLQFRFNTNDVKALQDALDTMASIASQLVQAGLIKVNEARKMVNQPADPEREGIYYVPMNINEVKNGKSATPPLPPTQVGGKKPPQLPNLPNPATPEEGGEGQPPTPFVKADEHVIGWQDFLDAKGGSGSGNYDHAGRPGQVGGSTPHGMGQLRLFTKKPYVEPPSPRGKPGKTKPGGASSSGEAPGRFGDRIEEHVVRQLKLRWLVEGKRHGAFDAGKPGTKHVFEVRGISVTNSSPYKMRFASEDSKYNSKGSVAHKLSVAKAGGLIPHMLAAVADPKTGTMWVYHKPGLDASRLGEKNGWNFVGKFKLPRTG